MEDATRRLFDGRGFRRAGTSVSPDPEHGGVACVDLTGLVQASVGITTASAGSETAQRMSLTSTICAAEAVRRLETIWTLVLGFVLNETARSI